MQSRRSQSRTKNLKRKTKSILLAMPKTSKRSLSEERLEAHRGLLGFTALGIGADPGTTVVSEEMLARVPHGLVSAAAPAGGADQGCVRRERTAKTTERTATETEAAPVPRRTGKNGAVLGLGRQKPTIEGIEAVLIFGTLETVVVRHVIGQNGATGLVPACGSAAGTGAALVIATAVTDGIAVILRHTTTGGTAAMTAGGRRTATRTRRPKTKIRSDGREAALAHLQHGLLPA